MRLRARRTDLAEKNAAKKLRLENGSTVWEDAAKRVSDIRDFYGRLAEDYAAVLSGERDVLFKMKELWGWQGQLFEGSEKYLKKIRKAQKLTEYKSAVAALFADPCIIIIYHGDDRIFQCIPYSDCNNLEPEILADSAKNDQ